MWPFHEATQSFTDTNLSCGIVMLASSPCSAMWDYSLCTSDGLWPISTPVVNNNNININKNNNTITSFQQPMADEMILQNDGTGVKLKGVHRPDFGWKFKTTVMLEQHRTPLLSHSTNAGLVDGGLIYSPRIQLLTPATPFHHTSGCALYCKHSCLV